ncbi:hypothetical protein [Rhodococcus opacus]
MAAVRRAGLSVVLADGDTRRDGIRVCVSAGATDQVPADYPPPRVPW